MTKPKRHHFVPKSYLEAFVEPESGFLNLFSKRAGLWRRQKPDQAMVRNKYYTQTWVPKGVNENVLELSLGSGLEPNGISALRKLVTNPAGLNDTDFEHAIAYIEFQRIRVPRQADTAKYLASKAVESILASDPTFKEVLGTPKLKMDDAFRFEIMSTASGHLARFLVGMTWELVHAPEHSFFITSDSPVMFWNERTPPPNDPGIALLGTVIFFPLDTKNLLIIRHQDFGPDCKEPLKEVQPAQNGVNFTWGRTLTKEDVDSQNCITYMLSQDLIAGPTKNCIDAAVGWETTGHHKKT